jgi:hypothetical protein
VHRVLQAYGVATVASFVGVLWSSPFTVVRGWGGEESWFTTCRPSNPFSGTPATEPPSFQSRDVGVHSRVGDEEVAESPVGGANVGSS